MAIFKPDVTDNDFEQIREIVERRLIEKGGRIDPLEEGRAVTNIVLSELGKRGYVVMKPTQEEA